MLTFVVSALDKLSPLYSYIFYPVFALEFVGFVFGFLKRRIFTSVRSH